MQSNNIGPDKINVTAGYCKACDETHTLGSHDAYSECIALMKILEKEQCMDFVLPEDLRQNEMRTEYLFGPARGKMLGVMTALTSEGERVVKYAFSGQYNGLWRIKGWVPPIVDGDAMARISVDVETHIKEIGRKMEGYVPGDSYRTKLKHQRRDLSRQLMRDIHDLYLLRNFKGEKRAVSDVFLTEGVPTGTGDCCAPKLLQYAVLNELKPESIAEFYWGKENRSGSKKHGCFYSACAEKCQPILGYMLCGL
ncbi:MAG: hypothetical protein ACNI27_01695 [Desulfovibrio sp.]